MNGTEARMVPPDIPLLAMLDWLVDALCKAVMCATCAAIFLILLANVILRYFFHSSLEWAAELPELLFPWFVMAGVVTAASHDAHIRIAVLVEQVGPATARALGLLRTVVILATYGLLSWVALDLLPIVADERSPVLHVPNSVTYTALLLGFALIVLKEITGQIRGHRAVPSTPETVPYE